MKYIILIVLLFLSTDSHAIFGKIKDMISGLGTKIETQNKETNLLKNELKGDVSAVKNDVEAVNTNVSAVVKGIESINTQIGHMEANLKAEVKASIGAYNTQVGGDYNITNDPKIFQAMSAGMLAVIGWLFAMLKSKDKWISNLLDSNKKKETRQNAWEQKYLSAMLDKAVKNGGAK